MKLRAMTIENIAKSIANSVGMWPGVFWTELNFPVNFTINKNGIDYNIELNIDPDDRHVIPNIDRSVTFSIDENGAIDDVEVLFSTNKLYVRPDKKSDNRINISIMVDDCCEPYVTEPFRLYQVVDIERDEELQPLSFVNNISANHSIHHRFSCRSGRKNRFNNSISYKRSHNRKFKRL